MKDTSKIIIESIRSGKNDEALKHLYKDPLRKVRKYILSNSGTLDDADDVFQDAIVVLFHYIKTGKFKEEYELEGFLFRVAKNAWINLARKKQKIIKGEWKGFDVSDGSDILTELIKDERLTTFHNLFKKLDENCREILSYVMFDKKSMKEIAQLMGYKDDKVTKNQHYRCKKYFSKLISEDSEALTLLRN